MAVKLSTGLVNWLAGGSSLRRAFDDCKLEIWSGTPPTTADAANTGSILCTVSKASGTTYLRQGWGEINTVTITTFVAGQTWLFDVTIGSETLVTTDTFTNTPDAGSAAMVAVKVARLFQAIGCNACATGTTGVIYVMAPSCKSLLIALNGTATGGATIVDAVLAADTNGECLHFGPPAIGIISKDSAVWSGVNTATGVAGYFRFVDLGDTHALSTAQRRLQGAVSTSGAELNLSNTTLTLAATTTIDSGNFTEPQSA